MPIYDSIYSIFHTYIYGGVDLSTYQEFVLVQLSTFFSVFTSILPFIAVLCILKFFLGTIARW